MIQKTYKISNKADFVSWLAEIKMSEEYNNAHSVLIKGLTAQFMDYDIMDAHNKIVETLPKAKVVGMSLTSFGRRNFDAPLNATRFFQRYVIASCSFFDKSEITLIECGNELLESGEMEIYIRNRLKKIPDIKAVEVMSTGKNRYNTTLLNNISVGYEDVPFFGAEAGVILEQNDDSAGYRSMMRNIADSKVSQYVIGDKYHRDGVLLIVYSGKDLQVYSEYNLSWKPLGKEMTITKALGSTCIAEIDGIPAVNIYQKYLNVAPDRFLLMNTCEFPFLIKRNNFTCRQIQYVCYNNRFFKYFILSCIGYRSFLNSF